MSKISEETITIKRDKVYSSYYARACKIVPDRRLVAISIGIPDNFCGEIMRELNPPSTLLYKYKAGLVNEEEYTEIYNDQVLAKLDANEVYNRLKGKVILCYCGKDKFCHRTLVMKWLEQNLGKEVIGSEI